MQLQKVYLQYHSMKPGCLFKESDTSFKLFLFIFKSKFSTAHMTVNMLAPVYRRRNNYKQLTYQFLYWWHQILQRENQVNWRVVWFFFSGNELMKLK